MRFLYIFGFILVMVTAPVMATPSIHNYSPSWQVKDSLTVKNIDINNRIARHFIEREPNLAFYYADSSAILALEFNHPKGLEEALSIKGEISFYRKDYQQSLEFFDKALTLSKEIKDTVKIMQSHLAMADVYVRIKELVYAEKHMADALSLKSITRYPTFHAKAITGLWQIYWMRNEQDTVAYFQEMALAIYNDNKQDKKIASEIASGFLKIADFDEALNYYQLSLEKERKSGDKQSVAEDLKSIGEIYLSKKRGKEALPYLVEARKHYLSMNNKSAQLGIAIDVGTSYLYMAQYTQAIKNLDEALQLAIDLKDLKAQAEANSMLSAVYEESGFPDVSISYLKAFTSLKDSIYREESARKIEELKANFEFDQKEKEIAHLMDEQKKLNESAAYKDQINRLNTNLLIFLAISMLLVLTLSVLIFYRYKAKKNANLLLSDQYNAIHKQKSEIEEQSKIIKVNNLQLEQARSTIERKNKELRRANEQLEGLIDKRTNELNRTYSKLSFHIDNTPLAVLEWNDKMELIRWSSQAEKIFGWEADEVLGKHIQDLPMINKDHQDSIDKIFAELLTGEKPRNFYKNQNFHKSGALIDVEWSNSILFNDEGRLESILSIANNVTVREKAIIDLKKSNMELDNFIYRASHDLRGPITRLVGVVNLGMLEAKEAVSRTYFDLLGKVAFEMNAMLSSLLTVHDIYQHQLLVEDVPMKNDMKIIVNEFRQKNMTFNVDLTYDFPAKLTWSTDRELFRVAMKNLIENAYVKSAEGGSKIVIKVRKINDYFLKISVSDNGVGYPKEVMDKVFDMFFQGSERANVNFGLGLYLVKKSVEKAGGNISLTKPSNDTTYEIILPNLESGVLLKGHGVMEVESEIP